MSTTTPSDNAPPRGKIEPLNPQDPAADEPEDHFDWLVTRAAQFREDQEKWVRPSTPDWVERVEAEARKRAAEPVGSEPSSPVHAEHRILARAAEQNAKVAVLLDFFSPEKIKAREAADREFENHMKMVEKHMAERKAEFEEFEKRMESASLKRERPPEFDVSHKERPELKRTSKAIEAAKACLQECAKQETDRAPWISSAAPQWTAKKAIAVYKKSEDFNPEISAHMHKLIHCTPADLDKIRDHSNAPEKRTVDEWNKLCAVGLLLAEHRCSK